MVRTRRVSVVLVFTHAESIKLYEPYLRRGGASVRRFNGVLVMSSGRSILFTLGLLLRPCTRGVGITIAPSHVRRFVAAFHPSVVLLSVGFDHSTVDNRRNFSDLGRVLDVSPRTIIVFVATCTSASGTIHTVGTKTASFVPGP